MPLFASRVILVLLPHRELFLVLNALVVHLQMKVALGIAHHVLLVFIATFLVLTMHHFVYLAPLVHSPVQLVLPFALLVFLAPIPTEFLQIPSAIVWPVLQEHIRVMAILHVLCVLLVFTPAHPQQLFVSFVLLVQCQMMIKPTAYHVQVIILLHQVNPPANFALLEHFQTLVPLFVQAVLLVLFLPQLDQTLPVYLVHQVHSHPRLVLRVASSALQARLVLLTEVHHRQMHVLHVLQEHLTPSLVLFQTRLVCLVFQAHFLLTTDSHRVSHVLPIPIAVFLVHPPVFLVHQEQLLHSVALFRSTIVLYARLASS